MPKLSFENDIPRIPSKGKLERKITQFMSHSEEVRHTPKSEVLADS